MQNLWRRKSGFLFRIVGWIAVTSFSIQSTGLSYSTLGIFQKPLHSQIEQASHNTLKVMGHPRTLPLKTGKIIRSFEGKSSSPVFLVQDAHFHLEAQKNSAAVVERLIEDLNIEIVGIEGAVGELWHDWATRYPDLEIRKDVFDYWIKTHEIGAVEYALSKTSKNVRLFGIEEEALYEKHLKTSRSIFEKRDEIGEVLLHWKKLLKSLLSQSMPKKYLEHINTLRPHENNLYEKHTALLRLAKEEYVDISTYPAIESYMNIHDILGELDQEVMMREYRGIQDIDLRVNILQLTINPSIEAIETIREQILSRQYQDRLPQILLWLEVLQGYSSFDESLLEEMEELDFGLRRSYLSSNEELWLDDLVHWTQLLEKWVKLEWAPEDVIRYQEENKRFFGSEPIQKIQRLISKYKVNDIYLDWFALFEKETWSLWMDFYLLALQRDEVFFEKTQSLLEQSNGKPVLIYTGGFHTPGLERILKEKEISFATIRPDITRGQEASEKKAYERALKENGVMFKKILKDSFRRLEQSKRISFELISPRQFPLIGEDLVSSKERLAFLQGGTILLSGMSAIHRVTEKSPSYFSQRSSDWWSHVTSKTTDINASVGIAHIETSLGTGGLRWKKSQHASGRWQQINPELQVQFSGIIDPQFLRFSHSMIHYGNQDLGEEDSLSTIALGPLKSREMREVSFLKSESSPEKIALVSESREEKMIDEDEPKISISMRLYLLFSNLFFSHQWVKKYLLVFVLFFFLGPMALAAGADNSAQTASQALVEAFETIHESSSNIGPGTSRHVSGHDPEWQLVQKFQEAYLRLKGDSEALGPYGADGIWGKPGSYTDLAFEEVREVVEEAGGDASKVAFEGAATEEVVAPEVIKPEVLIEDVISSEIVPSEIPMPQMEVPKIVFSEIEPPKIAMPEITIPQVEPTKIMMPEIDFPELMPPSIEGNQAFEEVPIAKETAENGERLPGIDLTAWKETYDRVVVDGKALLASDAFPFLGQIWFWVLSGFSATSLIFLGLLFKKNKTDIQNTLGKFPSPESVRAMRHGKLDAIAKQLTSLLDSRPELVEEKVHGMTVGEYAELLLETAEENQKSKIRVLSWKMPMIEFSALLLWGASLYFMPGAIDLLLLLKGAFAIRLGWTSVVLINEWSHVGVSPFVGSPSFGNYNLLGGHPLKSLASSFIPLFPMIRGGVTQFENASKWQLRLIRWVGWGITAMIVGGIVFGLLPNLIHLPIIGAFAGWVSPGFILNWTGSWFYAPAFIYASVFAVVVAFISDFILPPKENCAHCGLVTYGRRAADGTKGAIDNNDYELLLKMFTITIRRGGQAIGLSALVKNFLNEWKSVRLRHVAGRREFIPQTFSKMAKKYLKKYKTGTVLFIQGHLRFATGGGTAKSETHPHEGERKQVTQWYKGSSGWKKRSIESVNTITHNGDYDNLVKPNGDGKDAPKQFGLHAKKYTFDQVRNVIQYLTGTKNKTKVDSAVISMTMDLLHTKGVWNKSFLYAYMHTMEDFDSLFESGEIPQKVKYRKGKPRMKGYIGLTPNDREKMTLAWERTWEQFINTKKNFNEMDVERLLLSFLQDNKETAWGKKISPKTFQYFVRHTINGFFHQDTYGALREFMDHADGSFGLSVTSPLEPDRIAIASRYQPLSVGFGYTDDEPMMAIVSEADALKARTERSRFVERIDLDMFGGEVFQLGIPENGERSWIRGYSYAKKKEWDVETLAKMDRIISMEKSPYISRLDHIPDEKEWVKQNLKEIPTYLKTIEESYEESLDPESFNLKTVRAFGGFVAEKKVAKYISGILRKVSGDIKSKEEEEYIYERVSKMMRATKGGRIDHQKFKEFATEVIAHILEDRRGSSSITHEDLVEEMRSIPGKEVESVDLVTFGEENSFNAAQAAASSLGGALGGWRVRSVDAVTLLEAIKSATPRLGKDGKYRIDEIIVKPAGGGSPFRITRATLAIGYSHSGQNFSTALVTAALRKMIGDRIFIQTGEIDSRMALAIGQGLSENSPWKGRIFTSFPDPNKSSLHPSEASSLVTIAQQHTSSLFVLNVINNVRQRFRDFPDDVAKVYWTKSQIERMEQSLKTLSREKLPAILGVDAEGNDERSEINRDLKKKFRVLEKMFFESTFAWVASALYVLLTTTGIALGGAFFTYLLPSTYITMLPGLAASWSGAAVLGINYVFLAFTFTLAWRLVFGLSLFRRLGSPAVVIADYLEHIYEPASQFSIKLFSLAPGLVDPGGQYRANFKKDIANIFAPLTKRGNTVIIEGLPDERKPDGVDVYESGRVAGTQAKGVESHLFSFFRYIENWVKRVGTYVLAVTHTDQTRESAANAEVNINRNRVEDLSVGDSFVKGLIERLEVELPHEQLVKINSFKRKLAVVLDDTGSSYDQQDEEGGSDIIESLKITLRDLHLGQDVDEISLQMDLMDAILEILELDILKDAEIALIIDGYIDSFIQHKDNYLEFHSRHVDSVQRLTAIMMGLYYSTDRISALAFYGWALGQTQSRTKINTTASSVRAVGVQKVLDSIEEADPIVLIEVEDESQHLFRQFDEKIDSSDVFIDREELKTKGELLEKIIEPSVPIQAIKTPDREEMLAKVKKARLLTKLKAIELKVRANQLDGSVDQIISDLGTIESELENIEVDAEVFDRIGDVWKGIEGHLEESASTSSETRSEFEVDFLIEALSEAESVENEMILDLERQRLRELLDFAEQIQFDFEISESLNSKQFVLFQDPKDDELIKTIAESGKFVWIQWTSESTQEQQMRVKSKLSGVQGVSFVSQDEFEKLKSLNGWTASDILLVERNLAVEELRKDEKIKIVASLLTNVPESVVIYGKGFGASDYKRVTLIDLLEERLAGRLELLRAA